MILYCRNFQGVAGRKFYIPFVFDVNFHRKKKKHVQKPNTSDFSGILLKKCVTGAKNPFLPNRCRIGKNAAYPWGSKIVGNDCLDIIFFSSENWKFILFWQKFLSATLQKFLLIYLKQISSILGFFVGKMWIYGTIWQKFPECCR